MGVKPDKRYIVEQNKIAFNSQTLLIIHIISMLLNITISVERYFYILILQYLIHEIHGIIIITI